MDPGDPAPAKAGGRGDEFPATPVSVASMTSDGESSGSLTRPPPGPRGGPAGRPNPSGRTHARMRRGAHPCAPPTSTERARHEGRTSPLKPCTRTAVPSHGPCRRVLDRRAQRPALGRGHRVRRRHQARPHRTDAAPPGHQGDPQGGRGRRRRAPQRSGGTRRPTDPEPGHRHQLPPRLTS